MHNYIAIFLWFCIQVLAVILADLYLKDHNDKSMATKVGGLITLVWLILSFVWAVGGPIALVVTIVILLIVATIAVVWE